MLVAAVLAFLLLAQHRENFLPLVVAAMAGAGAGGAATTGFMLSGAKWTSGNRPDNVVSFYKDTNFAGKRKDYGNGAVQNSLSHGVFGAGVNKENDTYSSLKVPPGLQVQVWKDNDAKGFSAVFPPGEYPNLDAFGFHDNISSLKVTTTGTKCYVSGTRFTPRELSNGSWKCPSGWKDTGCDWVDGIGGYRQCSQ